MNVEELFEFLIKEYGLSYQFQAFTNCYYGGWIVRTYSFFNDSGCFTIHHLLQRDELDFYFAPHFAWDLKKLCMRGVNIKTIEPHIWKKHRKIRIFKNSFFWWSNKRILTVFAEALKNHLLKNNDFFGIKVQKVTEDK